MPMVFDADTVIRLLTVITLAGLLFSIGLALTWKEIWCSLRDNRLVWILPVNFVLVPALAFALVRLFQVPTSIAVAMLLLAAAPFAPVVPTFTRLARGDLALAGVLTGLFPFVSAFITPIVCELSLKPVLETVALKFNASSILLVLVSTITLPLAAGVAVRHWSQTLAARLVTPIRVFSEAIGTIALIFVTVAEFDSIRSIGWRSLLAMVLLSELSFFAGYALSGPAPGARLVMALGTANRNIALAVLVAVASFPGTPIVGAVVANGLVLIFCGLAHVGLWLLFGGRKEALV